MYATGIDTVIAICAIYWKRLKSLKVPVVVTIYDYSFSGKKYALKQKYLQLGLLVPQYLDAILCKNRINMYVSLIPL